jgi:hypothetical protein
MKTVQEVRGRDGTGAGMPSHLACWQQQQQQRIASKERKERSISELYQLVRTDTPEGALSRIGHIQEAIRVRVLVKDGTHEGCIGRDVAVHKDEDGLLSRELDTLANDIHKLSDSQVRGDEIFLLVNVGHI